MKNNNTQNKKKIENITKIRIKCDFFKYTFLLQFFFGQEFFSFFMRGQK